MSAVNRTRIIIEILHNVIAICMQYFSNIAAMFYKILQSFKIILVWYFLL